MNRLADFNQIFMHITLGHDDELIMFTPGLNLLNLCQKLLLCRISYAPVGRF